MRELKAAVIGAGSMATQVHYPSLAKLQGVTVAAACDLDVLRVQAAAERFGIPKTYQDYRRMVAEVQPDAVYAIGQPHLMYDVWTWCLQQGLHLYIEKPLGLSIHQARSLAWLAERHGCITQVSFQRRSCPMVVHLHAACLRRSPIRHAVCEFYKHAPSPVTGPRDHMMDDGVHALDTLRWLCGGEVRDIQSVTRRIGTPDANFFAALLTFDNGATGVMLNSWTSGRRVFRVQIHADGICAEAEHEGEGWLYADGDTSGQRFETREFAGSAELPVYGGFLAKHQEFVDAIRAGVQPSTSFADAVNTMEVAERILALDLLRST